VAILDGFFDTCQNTLVEWARLLIYPDSGLQRYQFYTQTVHQNHGHYLAPNSSSNSLRWHLGHWVISFMASSEKRQIHFLPFQRYSIQISNPQRQYPVKL
jgi:hypothetical protein